MYTNDHEIIIKSNISNVWRILTSSDELPRYLIQMKVVSDWKVGSPIVFTHYEEDGSITEWNDEPMIWNGVIEVLETNKQYDVGYVDGSGGLVRESYILEEISPHETKVYFHQEAISNEFAKNYREGNQYALESLKNHAETTTT